MPVGAQQEQARSVVSEIHRQRMLIAMAEAVRALGVSGVSVADVVSRAGVSRRTFYEAFQDRDDCLLAAIDYAVERAARRVAPAWQEQRDWRDGIRAGLAALLRFFDEEPVLGALLVLDWPAAGGTALQQRAEVIDRLVEAVDSGRELSRASVGPSSVVAEGVVGAVLAVVHSRLLERDGSQATDGEEATGASRRTTSRPARAARRGKRSKETAGGSMSDMLGELMGIVVLPYLGPTVAAKETSRPQPQQQASDSQSLDVLKDLKIRLTYRTVMVLRAVAEHPGTSNREIALHAEIADQGQVSKLLARIAQAGLIENTRRKQATREPNAWTLTAKGVAVEKATRSDEDQRD
ncbi:MAG TPA: TetR family transcriptional regulator [Solirubrobacteraceae bacterium]|jgi:AcrR family transcriptional regulator/DNA-binding MarR family transcriptional regulator